MLISVFGRICGTEVIAWILFLSVWTSPDQIRIPFRFRRRHHLEAKTHLVPLFHVATPKQKEGAVGSSPTIDFGRCAILG